MPSKTEILLPLRIILRRPPAGVRFALQRGAARAGVETELVAAQTADGVGDLAFECSVRVQAGDAGALRLLGPFVQGPPDARFIYITVGTRAGQMDSCWDRRAKVPLKGISLAHVKAATASSGAVLEATLDGTLADGSPICATRPFVEGWHLATQAPQSLGTHRVDEA
jgi:hypothetical protein